MGLLTVCSNSQKFPRELHRPEDGPDFVHPHSRVPGHLQEGSRWAARLGRAEGRPSTSTRPSLQPVTPQNQDGTATPQNHGRTQVTLPGWLSFVNAWAGSTVYILQQSAELGARPWSQDTACSAQAPGTNNSVQGTRCPSPMGRRPPCRCAFWAWKGCAAFIRLTRIGEGQTRNFPHLEDSGP